MKQRVVSSRSRTKWRSKRRPEINDLMSHEAEVAQRLSATSLWKRENKENKATKRLQRQEALEVAVDSFVEVRDEDHWTGCRRQRRSCLVHQECRCIDRRLEWREAFDNAKNARRLFAEMTEAVKDLTARSKRADWNDCSQRTCAASHTSTEGSDRPSKLLICCHVWPRSRLKSEEPSGVQGTFDAHRGAMHRRSRVDLRGVNRDKKAFRDCGAIQAAQLRLSINNIPRMP